MSDGSVVVYASGYDTWIKNQPRRVSDSEVWKVEFKSDDEQKVVVTDCRTLTDTAQYNIGWHDGYRANHNDETVAASYVEKDKRMVASLDEAIKKTIGG